MRTDETQMPWIARLIDPRYRSGRGDSTLAFERQLDAGEIHQRKS